MVCDFNGSAIGYLVNGFLCYLSLSSFFCSENELVEVLENWGIFLGVFSFYDESIEVGIDDVLTHIFRTSIRNNKIILVSQKNVILITFFLNCAYRPFSE